MLEGIGPETQKQWKEYGERRTHEWPTTDAEEAYTYMAGGTAKRITTTQGCIKVSWPTRRILASYSHKNNTRDALSLALVHSFESPPFLLAVYARAC
jgi:hypothetical protein